MSKGGSSTATERSSSTTELPGWVNRGGEQTYTSMAEAVKNITANPALTPEQLEAGSTYVAPLNQDHLNAIGEVRNRAFSHDPYFADPNDFKRRWNMSAFGTRDYAPDGTELLGFAPYDASTMSAFQNPWDQQVVDTTLADMGRQREIDRIRQQDASIAAGAFGGTGRALEEAELGRNWADKMAQYEAQLRSSGFLNAQQQFNKERDAWMSGLDRETAERATGADIGTKKQAADLTGAAALKGAGDWQREVDQDTRDAAARLRLEPIDLLTKQASTLGMVPTGSTTTGWSQTPQAEPDRFGQLLGAGATIGGAFLMSDKKKKKKIKDVSDKGEEVLGAFSKLPIDSYEYKDDAVDQYGVPPGPRLGPMAQETPGKLGGVGNAGLDMGNAIGALMLAVKALEQRTRRAAA